MNVTIQIPPWARHVVSDLTDMDRDPHPVETARNLIDAGIKFTAGVEGRVDQL